MKKCHKCKKHLRNDKFPSRNSDRCKLCKTKADTKLHKRRKKRKVASKSNDRRRSTFSPERRECTTLVARLKANPCTDCGVQFDSAAMDFDHLPQFKKVAGVSRLAAQGKMRELQIELKKCELVCANCHRVRTKNRGQ